MPAVKPDWMRKLENAVKAARAAAFVGIGHELRGDDAAGLLVVRRLSAPAGSAAAHQRPGGRPPLFLEAGPLPESVSGPLRRYQPDLVIFIDAADMDCAPGAVDWIDPRKAVGFSAGTHAFPLCEFSEYLAHELDCEVFFLGIQPENMEFDSPVSPPVRSAVDELAREIRRLAD
jgi:hydrogenase 3 maturation protease